MHISGLGIIHDREYNTGFLKRVGTVYQLTHMNSVRCAGLEAREVQPALRGDSNADAAERFLSSISRAKTNVFQLAACNPWDYFVTLTISADKHNRYDLPGTFKKLSKWFNNYHRYAPDFKYLLVPEPHKDGAWHFHGMILGLPVSYLELFCEADHIPNRLKEMIRQGRCIYNWPAYANTFGYVTLERIRDKQRCAAYMSKYITKELGQSSIEANHHLYYSSQGLKRAELIFRGPMMREIEEPDYENEYVKIKVFETEEQARSYFLSEEGSKNNGQDNFDGQRSCCDYAD